MMTAKAAHKKDLSGKPVTMTHQHYRKIAEIIRGITVDGEDVVGYLKERHLTASIAEQFADALASTNPNFDRARFLAACKA